jgi:hypothetical protein
MAFKYFHANFLYLTPGVAQKYNTFMMRLSSLLFVSFLFSSMLHAQDDCYKKLEDAFTKRGSYTVADDMHRNVILCYFEKSGTSCISGKVRVENGQIVSIFIQYDDNTYELMDKKFYNDKKLFPIVTNGISEMIYTADGEKLKVVFIEKLKPKQKTAKEVVLPDDL